MEKNFLNITPESGNGNQEVTINAKANISLEDREELLRIRSSTGKDASVRITQDGVPFMANIGVVPRNIFPSGIGYPIDITFSKTTWDSEGIPTTELKVSNTDEEKFEVIPYFQLLIRKDIVDELLPPGVNQGGSTYYLEDKSEELYSIDEFWYLKDDWVYVGWNWNMDSSEGSHIPSATLDYDPGDGYYKTIFEWIFSDGIDNILPQ